ncbi:hypothetical protein CLIB1423_22S01332 [[Candida] railenensis]|uniref:Uncharacterized protein n=1 Tax=[Candida] railenensis TaxID=45579 RepID=A0A9P0QU97_9ASCO|nr:hypothetical protein CLIB1423_22S01332 [[Candida] railenensis]
MKYYSAIDRFFNKFRKKGFLLYATLVIAATAYSFYSISNLPDVKELEQLKEQKRKKEQLKKSETDKKKEVKAEEEEEEQKDAETKKLKESESPSKKSSSLFVDEELSKDHSKIDNWSRRELHSYLSRHKIYPDLDTSLEDLIEQVKVIYYENKVAHFI